MLNNKTIKNIIITSASLIVGFGVLKFISEMNWDETDFFIMGVLITGTFITYKLITIKAKNKTTKFILGLGLVLLFIYVWAELAVGIFTNLGN